MNYQNINNTYRNIAHADSLVCRLIKFWKWVIVFMGVLFIWAVSTPYSIAQNTEKSMADTASAISEKKPDLYKNHDFTSVLTIKQIRAFGDYSAKEALIRIPGSQVSRDGEINLRGAGYNSYAVLLNGQRIANTGLGTREINLGNFSTDAIRQIQVTKVLDPSMDADALAGVINLSTVQPSGENRKLSAIAGGGANPLYISRTGPGSRGWLNYTEQFSAEFSIAFNLSFQQDYNSREELGIGYGVEEFNGGQADVINRVSPSLQIDESSRLLSTLEARYVPSGASSYYFRAFFNNDDMELVTHRDSWLPNEGWVNQTTTEGEMGVFSHEASLQNINTTYYVFQGGGKHEFESVNLIYNAGWSQGRAENNDYLFPFQIEGLDYSVNLNDWNRPQLEITNRPSQILDDGTVDRQFMIGQNFERTLEEHVNNEFTTRVDVEYPISPGTIKAGTNVRLSSKDGEYDQNSFEYNRTLRMISFNMLREPNRNVDVINDNYRIPWFVNTDNARAFLETQRPLFTGDDNLRAYESEIRNYNNVEQIYAAYAMADLDFGKANLKGGVRVEYFTSKYTGNEVIFNEDGDLESANEVEESTTGFQLFPNAQLGFDISEKSSLRLAYSQSIDRPDYFFLTPFERIDNQDSTLYSGEHLLDPVISDNIDLMIKQQVSNTGIISVAAFYKELSNFVVMHRFSSANQPYDGYQGFTFSNSDETATIFGVELSAEQSLSFLPGLLKNFGLYANYTFSQSNYETDRNEVALPHQRPHVVNAALKYTQGRFSGQVSYHWSDEALTELQDNEEQAPSIEANAVYLDRYEDGLQELSATLGYQLSDRFRAWANVYNILNTERIEYANSREFYPTSTYIRNGLDIRIGVRFDL